MFRQFQTNFQIDSENISRIVVAFFIIIPTLFLSVKAFSESAPSSPLPIPLPEMTMTPHGLTSAEKKALLFEYTKAQKLALSANKHRNRKELENLEASQKSSMTEWWNKQQEARREYFKSHKAGKERRTFMQELYAKRKSYRAIQIDEYAKRRFEGRARLDTEIEAQMRNLKEFKENLALGKTPPRELWPENR